MRCVLADIGFNEEDILTYVYAVNNRLFTRVFADYVLVEKRKGTLIGSCGQTDNKGIEILST